MSISHEAALDKALVVIKEYAHSGSGSPSGMLEAVYNKIVEIAKKDGFFYDGQ